MTHIDLLLVISAEVIVYVNNQRIEHPVIVC